MRMGLWFVQTPSETARGTRRDSPVCNCLVSCLAVNSTLLTSVYPSVPPNVFLISLHGQSPQKGSKVQGLQRNRQIHAAMQLWTTVFSAPV